MMTRWVAAFVGLALIVPGVTRADKTTDKILAAVPADAMAFICVPNLQQLDGDIQKAINSLGLAPFINPPSMASPLGLLEKHLGISDGLNDTEPLIVAILPPAIAGIPMPQLAVIIPTTDAKALLTGMDATKGEGGVWSLSIMGQPAFAVESDGRVVLAQSAETAKAVANGKTGIADSMTQADRDALEGLDLAIWINATESIKTFRPQIDGMLAMASKMQPRGSMESAASGMDQIKDLIDGAKSITLGVSLDDSGLGLRFVLGVDPGTKFGKQMKIVTTTKSLLNGLAPDSYMLAFGETLNPEAAKASMDNIDPWFETLAQEESIDGAQVDALKNAIKEWAASLTGIRGTVSELPVGPNGIIGLCLLIDTGNSAQCLTHLSDAVKAIKGLSTDGDFKQVVDAFSLDTEAETIDGTTVQQLKFDLASLEDVDEEDLEELTPIIGQDGLMVRIAAVNDETVVIGFGGGADYMARVLQHAKKNESTLDADPGIQKVSGHVPSDRAQVAYIAVDRIINCIGTVAKVLDDEEFPVQMAELNAPLTFVSTGGDGWVRVDTFIPVELIDAAKNAAMAMMMSQMGGPGMGAPAGSPN